MRASKFILLGLLALFSNYSYSLIDNYGDPNNTCSLNTGVNYNNVSLSWCRARLEEHAPSPDWTSAGESLSQNIYYPYEWSLTIRKQNSNQTQTRWVKFYFPNGYNPNDHSDLPTDQECSQRADQVIHRDTFATPQDITEPDSAYEINGCLYVLSGKTQCYMGIVGNVICDTDAINFNTSASGGETPISQPTTQESATEYGGQESTYSSSSPPVTQQDTPLQGESTTTQTDTESTTTADHVEIDNTSEKVEIVTTQEGDVQVNTTTTTITHADGSTTETIEKTYFRDVTTKETVTIDQDTKTPTTTTETIPSSNGTTTTTTTTATDGSTTTTTSNTGSGGSGQSDFQNQVEGNCFDSEECTVKMDESGIDLDSNNNQIQNAVDSLKNQRDTTISDFNSDGSQDYGLSGVAGFSSDNFISRYLVLPPSNCSGSINTTIFGHAFIIEPCDKLQPLRDVLAWVFFVLTFFSCIKILLNTRSI